MSGHRKARGGGGGGGGGRGHALIESWFYWLLNLLHVGIKR